MVGPFDVLANHRHPERLFGRRGRSPWAGIDGLLLKFWMADAGSNRWGAVMVWSDTADPLASLPPNRATELIGYPPTERLSADLHAIVGDIAGLTRHHTTLTGQPTAATP
ncbi:hypothetical protein LZK80_33345 (plasmid) [Rhizobium leguminosarum]|nr:hypothetical protein LZK80_33345 [Rhizobium leguminosarum]UIL30286.1 hypothetical protein LZK75_28060 [Rhizobium leguminosarum]